MGQFATVTGTWAVRRRLYRLLGLALVLLSLALVLPAGAVALSATNSSARFARTSAGDVFLASVTFTDAAYGWAVGSYRDASYANVPVLLATSDGGITWNARDVSSAGSDASLNSISFVDAQHGWAVGSTYDDSIGSAPLVLATSDGGITWDVQYTENPWDGAWLSSVTFVDASHGWAVGTCGDGWIDGMPAVAPYILATSDGGATWNEQYPGDVSLLDGMASLNSVTFVDAKHGWAVGSAGDAADETAVIVATSDGGATWATQQSSSRDGYGGLYSVSFIDAKHGWGVGGAGGEQSGSPVLIGTSDGGVTWSNESPPEVATNSFLESVRFIDATHGWAVGTRNRGYSGGTPTYVPVILVTVNGGATWQPQDASSAGADGGLGSVTFVDSSRGWAVGSSGTIIATSDGGATWGRQHGNVPSPTVTLKLTGLKSGAIKLGKRVTAKGAVTPTSLAGSQVKLTVQKKRSARWVTLKSVKRTISATGAYSWKYKPAKRGAYRMKATLAKTATHTAAKSKWRSFRVK